MPSFLYKEKTIWGFSFLMETSIQSNGCLSFIIRTLFLGDYEKWWHDWAWGTLFEGCKLLLVSDRCLSSAPFAHTKPSVKCTSTPALPGVDRPHSRPTLDLAMGLASANGTAANLMQADAHTLWLPLLLRLHLEIVPGIPAEARDTGSRLVSQLPWQRPQNGQNDQIRSAEPSNHW